MDLRTFTEQDLPSARLIHEKFYKEEFSFEEFLYGLQASFILEGNNGIISIAGIRPIAEIVMLTDKEQSVRNKQEALTRALGRLLVTTGKLGYQGAHAFIQDSQWEKVMKRHGFRESIGKCLVIG